MPSCAVFTRALDWPIKTPSVPIDRVLKAPQIRRTCDPDLDVQSNQHTLQLQLQ